MVLLRKKLHEKISGAFYHTKTSNAGAFMKKLIVTAFFSVFLIACQPNKAVSSVPPTPEEIVDTEWSVTSMNDTPLEKDSKITIRFGSDNRVSGSSGCNQYGGRYVFNEGKIKVYEPLIGTLKACFPETLMQQETNFTTLLIHMDRLEKISENELMLSNEKSETIKLQK